MDILKAEIARKRKLIEEKELIDVSMDCSRMFRSSDQFTLYTAVFLTAVFLCNDVLLLFLQDSKKYFKRADLARKEEEEYYRRCGYKVQTSVVDIDNITS